MTRKSPNNISVGGLLLAAGQSTRVEGGFHKLLSEFDGVPLVRRSALTLLDSKLSRVVAVTGHRQSEMQAALRGLPVVALNNPDFAKGLGTSIACGFSYRGFSDCEGVLIMLADMPTIRAEHLNELLEAFASGAGTIVVRGSQGRTPGHPVIIPKSLFADMRTLGSEDGGRTVIEKSGLEVKLIDIGPAATGDVDTAQAVSDAGGVLRI